MLYLLGNFFQLASEFPNLKLYVDFSVGKNFVQYNINHLATKLGENHSDVTVHYFFGKGKKTLWDAWKAFPAVTETFISICEKPYQPVLSSTRDFHLLERFTVTIYDRTSSLDSVNEASRELFSKIGKSLENIPPTQVTYNSFIKFQGIYRYVLAGLLN